MLRVCMCVLLSYLSGIQSACAVLYSHLWPVLALPFFSTLFHKRHIL